MQKITTFLTDNNQAEEAVNFYTSIIADSKIVSTNWDSEGANMSAIFQLA